MIFNKSKQNVSIYYNINKYLLKYDKNNIKTYISFE